MNNEEILFKLTEMWSDLYSIYKHSNNKILKAYVFDTLISVGKLISSISNS